ncbi:Hypothetical predicted protein [Cloeon dipterum]|uniref:Uncharacterized protein n=1 Tax=Cloeon dipterum TaxID=197152 RepID=A0A8S1CBV3_9INSE|nr:Hypothetical predicted protein [Cloeon dipterum]
MAKVEVIPTCESDAKHKSSLLVLNTVLSCWNIFCLFSIASQILWFRKIKQRQHRIAKAKEYEHMCADTPFNRERETSEPIYEEVGPVPSTSAHNTVAQIHN